ncbi:MAG: GGDEF domain-containing protein [Burkholderiaceae bacterium]|nr:GGDEF domain-containing protein [Burkholderiaceae bacterium]
MARSGSTFYFLRQAAVLLTVLTAALLTWHRFGMNRVLELDARHGFSYTAQDDRPMGGASIAAIEHAARGEILTCELSKKYTWPFCQASIRLAAMPGGVDLTEYDSVTFEIAYSGPGSHTVRFYLRNFEPGISNQADVGSLKVNEVEFPIPESGTITVPIKFFRVASWWATNYKVPLTSTDMRIDNVPFVEMSTGSLVQPGSHRIEIKSVYFSGKWISQAQLVMALLGAWVMFGASWLILALQYFRFNMLESRSREVYLQSINQALQLETEELAGQARTDPLTGALNREGLREFLMTQWQGRIPADSPLTVIFADLDHFKQINDMHGHSVGDVVLQEFARLVQTAIRTHDRLVRWGGEEFLIVCQDTCTEQGRALAEKLRADIVQSAWPEKLRVTCSFGVTMHRANEDIGAMIARADGALYQAKNAGRNRVSAI